MFTKVGQLKTAEENGPIILENAEGKNYEVNSVIAFVWGKLDGATTNEKISEELSTIAQIENTEATSVVTEAIKALQDVELVQAEA